MDTIEAAPRLHHFSGDAPSRPLTGAAGPFPLIVGVTGHNDLVSETTAPLRAQARRVLGRLQKTYPHTPIQVLTALAEGADQLVAEEALALKLPLATVLPMPLADYETTFATDAGRARLHELWNKSQLQIVLPDLDGEAGAASAALQYEHAGLVIASFSHVLLVLWNGLGRWDPNAGEADRQRQQGGTAHVAYLRAMGGCGSAVLGRSPVFPSSHTGLKQREHGLSFRIAAPRRKTEGCVGEAGSLWRLESDGNETAVDDPCAGAGAGAGPGAGEWTDDAPRHPVERRASASWQAAEAELAQLDEANSLLAEHGRKHADALVHSAEHLLPSAAIAKLDAQRPALERIRQAYAFADVFSQANQRCIYWAIRGIVVTLPAAVFSFELYTHFLHGPVMLAIYLMVIIIPVLVHRFLIRRRAWQNRFQDFRALAEALRVQFFWGLAGLPCPVTGCYLRKHHHEMNWIRQTLLGPALQSLAVALEPGHHDLVRTFWIDDQFAYFSGNTVDGQSRAGKAEQNRKTYQRYQFWATITYGSGIGVGAALLMAYRHLNEHVHALAIVWIGVAPALAAAISIAAEKRAYREHAHQYRRMGQLFGEAAMLIRHQAHALPDDFRAIVQDLGAEALAENGDWLLAHRERQVEPIKGG